LQTDIQPPDDSSQDSPEDESDDEFSLDDLGAAYARAMIQSGISPGAVTPSPLLAVSEDSRSDAEESTTLFSDEGDDATVSPLTIVEAALFVGHPENRPLTAGQIAGTMRGVSADEVDRVVEELNTIYQRDQLAFQIYQRDGGYVFGLRESMRAVRAAFYGKIRDTRLTQAAVDVLALVAYQPGITAAKITDQRGKDSAAVVNQMVRRELLEVRREPREDGKPISTYYPTARLLNLLGLENLADLPQVDEDDIAPRL
jgi:segregation and condensation protein B